MNYTNFIEKIINNTQCIVIVGLICFIIIKIQLYKYENIRNNIN